MSNANDLGIYPSDGVVNERWEKVFNTLESLYKSLPIEDEDDTWNAFWNFVDACKYSMHNPIDH